MERKYSVNLLFRGGSLNCHMAKVETTAGIGETIAVRFEGAMLEYVMLDGPALRTAIEDSSSHPNLCAAAQWKENV